MKVVEGDGAILLRQRVSAELDRRGELQRRDSLDVRAEPSAIFGRAASVAELRQPTAELEGFDEVAVELLDAGLAFQGIGQLEPAAFAELLEQRCDLVVSQVLVPLLRDVG